MATIAEVEKLAFDLPESHRAVLAARLLGSLPAILHDEDEGIAEALRRDADLEAEKSLGSLMPAGLVNPLTRQELRDLFCYLSGLGKAGR